MKFAGYVLSGWAIFAVGLGTYWWRIQRRTRRALASYRKESEGAL